MNPLLKDIIFCSYDTLSDRLKLLKPALFSVLISLCFMLIYKFSLGLNIQLSSIGSMLSVLVLTCLLAQRLKYNFVLFLPSFSLFLISLNEIHHNPHEENWLHMQILSVVLINFIGSTRCNVINFLIITSTSLYSGLFEIEAIQIIRTQAPLFFIFPLALYNSFYKTTLNINHIKDIQKMHDYELELLQREKDSQIAQATSIVAHEINNALTVLRVAIDRVEKTYSGEEKVCSHLNKAYERIHTIVDLIKKKSYVNEEMHLFSLSSLIKEEVMFLGPNFMKMGINLIFDYKGPEITIFGNETDMAQIIGNFCTNSRDAFIKRKDTHGEKVIEISLQRKDDQIILSFYDNAGGIPEEIKERIFDKGFSTKGRGDGAGLGLFYVKEVVRRMQGSVDLESENGTTTFKLIFQQGP